MTTSSLPGTATGAPPLLRPAVTAVVASAVGVALVHLGFDAAGADFRVAPGGQDPQTVGAGQAAAIGALGALVGGLLAAATARFTARPSRWLTALVVLGLVVMAANPVLAADQALTVVALEVMHLAVAGAFLAVVLPALAKRRPVER